MAMSSAERMRRCRARKRGENVPKMRPGVKRGYKQTPEHIAATKAGIKSGAEHHLWKGDTAIGKHTGHRRAQTLYPAPGACEQCGDQAGDRHHRDGNPLNNHPDNVAFMCRSCHMLIHRGNA